MFTVTVNDVGVRKAQHPAPSRIVYRLAFCFVFLERVNEGVTVWTVDSLYVPKRKGGEESKSKNHFSKEDDEH